MFPLRFIAILIWTRFLLAGVTGGTLLERIKTCTNAPTPSETQFGARFWTQ